MAATEIQCIAALIFTQLRHGIPSARLTVVALAPDAERDGDDGRESKAGILPERADGGIRFGNSVAEENGRAVLK